MMDSRFKILFFLLISYDFIEQNKKRCLFTMPGEIVLETIIKSKVPKFKKNTLIKRVLEKTLKNKKGSEIFWEALGNLEKVIVEENKK